MIVGFGKCTGFQGAKYPIGNNYSTPPLTLPPVVLLGVKDFLWYLIKFSDWGHKICLQIGQNETQHYHIYSYSGNGDFGCIVSMQFICHVGCT